MSKNLKKLGKYLAKVLRHSPEELDLNIHNDGWVKTSELLKKLKGKGFDDEMEDIEQVVKTDDKGRFSLSDDGKWIRANQGHSIDVKIDFEPKKPPQYLYHGTKGTNIKDIKKDGLQKMKRHHVHLSPDWETAYSVGKRYGGEPMIIRIKSGEMHEDGYEFFLSDNGVWLTDYVPPEYLEF